MAIGLTEGRPTVRFNLGTGVGTLVAEKPVTENEWHTIVVSRDDNRGMGCFLFPPPHSFL